MSLRIILLGGFVLAGGCSSTVHYQAVGFYSETSNDAVAHFSSEEACTAADESGCTKIVLNWETERYCGIYRGADDAVSEQVMRVGKSPFALTNWQLEGDQTLLLGDDEFFVSIDAGSTDPGSDIICGKFEPPANLVNIREDDVLNLRIFCRAVPPGIRIMPGSATGYPLNVAVASQEKTWFGCR